MDFNFLKEKYPCFMYEDYNWKVSGKNLKIFFDFKIEPSISFSPEITIKNINKERILSLKKEVIDHLIFNLGLVEMLSYWKATCSQKIIIETGNLTKEQIKWWQDLLLRGMSQFFYENRINWRQKNFVKITSKGQGGGRTGIVPGPPLKDRVLLAVGGGKDSIVTLEILKTLLCTGAQERNKRGKIGIFCLNPQKVSSEIIKISGIKNNIFVERKIDRKLLELNQRGFLNGHTPFSAYLAFLSVLLGYIFDYKELVFSNERSSNEGNVKYLGETINHQYSKSFDFEKKFRQYSKKYLLKDIEYFSFLRPLYELQIAKIFSRYPKYFSSFLSCNEAQKTASGTKKPTQKWCCKCPKCLFIFVILFPFLKENEVLKIFGKNLFADKKLIPLMKELIGYKNFKPFECIGTKKESLVAFYLSYKKYRKKQQPVLLKYLKEKILPKEKALEKEAKKILNSWNDKNFLNNNLPKILKDEIK